jgi:hypothetical protein
MDAGRGSIVEEPGEGILEIWSAPTDEPSLLAVLDACFEEWQHIRFGPLIQGSAWEIAAPRRPTLSVLDGYVTIDFGEWHCHICIGEHRGAEPAVAAIRRCARAELYRRLHDDRPTSWGLRLFNGRGEQQLTVLLPNPFLDDADRPLAPPDWSRLALWDRLRERFLGLPADPVDRRGTGFVHS